MSEDRIRGVPSLLQHLRNLPEEYVPSAAALAEIVRGHLVVTGRGVSREAAVAATVKLISNWYMSGGRNKAVRMIETFLMRRGESKDDADDGKGNGRGPNQLGDLSIPAAMVIRPTGGKTDTGCEEEAAPSGLRVLVGGRGERPEEGDGASEPPAGATHRGSEGRSEGISRRLVALELAEHRTDLQVFQKAYSGIRARVRTVEDEARLMKLATWSGTTACLGLLELVVHNVERVISELESMLKKIDAGEIPNLDEE